MGRISTHLLDTALGRPAAGVVIDLHRMESAGRLHVTTTQTNADGRTDAPLLLEPQVGTYELTFHAGDYLRRTGALLTEPPFLDQIVIRFGVADSGAGYHVPLLLSPYGYSTYRGS